MKSLAAALAWFLCGLFVALTINSFAETWAAATLGSRHFDRGAGFNEKNFGLGIEVRHRENGRIVGGFYRNSINRTSLYGGYAWAPELARGVRGGIVGGAVTGYHLSPAPLVAPVLMLEGHRVGLNLIVVPTVREKVPGMVGLQIKIRGE